MTARAPLIGAVVAVLIALVVYWLVRGNGSGQLASRDPRESAGSVASGKDAQTPDHGTAPSRRAAHTAAERTALLAAIAAARTQRTSAPVPAPSPSGSATATETGTTLDITDRTGDTSAWEKRTLGKLNALLGECYDLGRAEDPSLEGSVVLRFTLAGEPKVGGVLERVELDDEHTSIHQATLRDCMTESLYALELDPPSEGVRVERELSLKFP